MSIVHQKLLPEWFLPGRAIFQNANDQSRNDGSPVTTAAFLSRHWHSFFKKGKQGRSLRVSLPTTLEMCSSNGCRSHLSVAKLYLTFATSGTVACQAPLSMGFSRQEYWSGLPFPSPEIFPDQGSNPHLLHWQMGFFTTEPPGKPKYWLFCINCQLVWRSQALKPGRRKEGKKKMQERKKCKKYKTGRGSEVKEHQHKIPTDGLLFKGAYHYSTKLKNENSSQESTGQIDKQANLHFHCFTLLGLL